MLSKIASVFDSRPARNAYSDEEVENAVNSIKAYGKRSAGRTDEASMDDITEILGIMKKYPDSLPVQRVACHAISNLAMQVVAARWIVQKNGFALIHRAINNFVSDHKLCWLASSAVWNLARPPANRNAIGKDGAMDMLKILRAHHNRDKVSNTAIGALSNLSLLENLKDLIAQADNVELILAVLCHCSSKEELSVMTSGSGLLANIAVSDEHASTLLNKGVLDIILPVFQWSEDETLYRNACAALNNLVTAEGFLSAFLRAKGVEVVLDFLATHNQEMYAGLLENCLASIDADSNVKTTSLHYSCFHGKLAEFEFLYKRELYDFDLNASVDGRGMTVLDYALMNKHVEVVEYLSKLGAHVHSQKLVDDDTEEDESSEENKKPSAEELKSAVHRGQEVLRQTKDAHFEVLSNTLKHFPTDLCLHLTGYQSNMDMLTATHSLSL